MKATVDINLSRKFPDFLFSIIVLIAALSIRLIFLYQISDSSFNPLYLDSSYYDSWALEISKGDVLGKEIFYGLPLYPYFLGLLYFIFGRSIFIVQIVQASVDAISCVLLYYIGKLIFSRAVGIIAALIFAFYGMSLYFESYLSSVSLAIFFTLIIILVLFSIYKKDSFLKWIFVGFLIGTAALVNSSVILFLPFIAVWSYIGTGQTKRVNSFLRLCFMLAAFLSIISMVTLRNYVVGKDFVPVTSHGGITFYAGNNPYSNGSFYLPANLGRGVVNTKIASRNIAEQALGRKLKPSEVSAYWYNQAFNFIKNKPRMYLKLTLKKIYLFWWVREIPEGLPFKILKKYSLVLKLPLFGFAFISPFSILGLMISYRKKRKDRFILYLFLCSILLATTTYFVNSRYKMLAEPILILFAASALSFIYTQMKEKKYVRLFSIVAGVFFLYVILNSNFATSRKDIVYNQIGASCALKGNFAKAEEAFKQSITLNPSYSMAHYNLGTLYLNQKKYNEAVKELEEAVRLNPGYTDAYNNLGTIYNIRGQYKEAIRYFENSLRTNPYQENIKRALADLKNKQ
ncbi:MAG: tetratricopeptide repeat protein [Candidatus Omnitrophica bacterium]|nr:tetratricopeptide repeat protein [Candidatus Omnitrophota bacterium]